MLVKVIMSSFMFRLIFDMVFLQTLSISLFQLFVCLSAYLSVTQMPSKHLHTSDETL